MKTSRNSVPLSSKTRALAAALIALLCCWNAGCGKRVAYVEGNHKLTKMNKGDPAPHAGVLITDAYLSQIYEALGNQKCSQPPCSAAEPVRAD
jgi:hypothetical protein